MANGKGNRMTKETLLESLSNAYQSYFNLTRDMTLDGLPVAVGAEYHARDERYVLTREVQLWAAESNEYAYFVLLEELNQETLKAYFDAVVKHALERIDPTTEHMKSDITLVLLTDRIHPEAERQLQRL